MTNFSKRMRMHLAVWAASLALAGCFGGSDDASTPVAPITIDVLTTVPGTASTSIAGLIAYQRDVLARSQADQDKAEPIDIAGVTLPTSDTTEPVEV